MILKQFRSKLESYAPISQETWENLTSFAEIKILEKDEILIRNGQIAKETYYLYQGAMRAYFTDLEGNIYNKNIFLENDFVGSTVSAINSTPSNFTIEALEKSTLISLNYRKFRKLIETTYDLKDFYIAYLEKNWVIEKEEREISLVMENALERYLKLLKKHPTINQRIPQLHLAAHLGITPTQLSRIRKKLNSNQHM